MRSQNQANSRTQKVWERVVLNADPNKKKEINDEGYLFNWDVPIARDGEFSYPAYDLGFGRADGVEPSKILKFYRPASCFTDEVIASAKRLLFTNDHPDSPIDSNSATSHTSGVALDCYFKPGNKSENGIFYAREIVVWDAQTIEDIEQNGKKEVSVGFTAQYILKPIEINGVLYDGLEIIIRFNHLSLVVRGKAGQQFKMHTDTKEEKQMTTQAVNLVKMTINGVETELPVEDAFKIHQKNTESFLESFQKNHAVTMQSLTDSVNALTAMVKNAMEKATADNRVGADEPIEKDKLSKNEGEMEDKKEEKKDAENEYKEGEEEKESKNEDEPEDEKATDNRKNAKNSDSKTTLDANMKSLFGTNANKEKITNDFTSNMASIAHNIKDFS